MSDPSTSRFDEFWSAYPRKESKKRARATWKSRKLGRIADRIIADVKARVAECRQWQEGFIPLPTTYLNQDRWEDEWRKAPRPQANGDWKSWAEKHCPAKVGETWEEWKARAERMRRGH